LNETHSTGIEGNFFFLSGAASHFNAVSDGTTILARPFFNANPTSPLFGTNDSLFVAFPGLVRGDMQTSTTSQLLGADVYLRQAVCCGCGWRVDLLAGYRYLRLHEGLDISETEIGLNPANPVSGVPFVIHESFNTTNNFHGGELGFIGEYQCDRWFIRAAGKVALGGTVQTVAINGNTQFGAAPAVAGGFLTLPSNIGQYDSTRFAVVPEGSLNIGYAITPNVRVFGGYTFLFWNRVVRPGDQVDLRINTSQPSIGSGLVGQPLPTFQFRESSFWAQAINFGLEVRY
jgi:hypothetical protein